MRIGRFLLVFIILCVTVECFLHTAKTVLRRIRSTPEDEGRAEADLLRDRDETEFEKLQKLVESRQRSMFNQVGNLQQTIQQQLQLRQQQQQQLQSSILQQSQSQPQSTQQEISTTSPTLTQQPQPEIEKLLLERRQQQEQQTSKATTTSIGDSEFTMVIPPSPSQSTTVPIDISSRPPATPASPISPGQIFVCTNRWCREKGADATMATFSFLSGSIPVVPVNCLGRCNKGPNIRIFTAESAFIEASMVRSVETVVALLQEHLNLNVNITSAEVLRLNYEGNVFLREGDVDKAVECYNQALALGDKEQEGVLLVMRGSALLQRAYACRLRYKDIISYAEQVLPSMETIKSVLDLTLFAPSNSNRMSAGYRARIALDFLLRLSAGYGGALGVAAVGAKDSSSRTTAMQASGAAGSDAAVPIPAKWATDRDGAVPTSGRELLKKASLAYSMYEFALMRALEDLLTATVVLPGFAQAWRRAGDVLGELQHFGSAIEYYEVAARLDSSLAELLLPVVERLRVIETIVSNAEAKGWSKDTIRGLIEDMS